MKTQSKAEFEAIRDAGKISVFGIIYPYCSSQTTKLLCRIGVTDAVTEPTLTLNDTGLGEVRENIYGALVPSLDVLDKELCMRLTGVRASHFQVLNLKDESQTLKTVE